MAVITTKDSGYEQRGVYVNETLNDTFRPVEDIRNIRYAVTDTTKDIVREIVRIESWLGIIAYLDVTAISEEEILKSVIHFTVAEGEPSNLITEPAEIRKAARMFS